MNKKANSINVDPGMVNINTHEFTLGALAYLTDVTEELEKKLKWQSFKQTVLTCIVVGYAIHLYKEKNKKDIIVKNENKEVSDNN